MPAVERPDAASSTHPIASSAVGRADEEAALAALGVLPGDRVLDLGCGPGADLRAVSAAAGPAGRVRAVDLDPATVEAARRRTAEDPAVEVLEGDVQALDLPSASFDRARADRVPQHVQDAAGVLAEVARPLRPGGTAGLVEPDRSLMAIDAHDLGASHAFTAHTCRHVVRNAHIGRQLPRLGDDAVLSVVSVSAFPVVFTDVEGTDAVLGLTRNTVAAVRAGHLEESRSSAWLADLATGRSTAVVTVIATLLARPRSSDGRGRFRPPGRGRRTPPAGRLFRW